MAGCGHEKIIIDSNRLYVRPGDFLPGSGLYIADVIDKRRVEPELIGNIEGYIAGEKRSIRMNENVDSYIKKYFNSLLNYDQSKKFSHAVRVEMTKFILTENYTRKDSYYLYGTFIFTYLDQKFSETISRVDIRENFSKDEEQLFDNINASLKKGLQDFLSDVSWKNYSDSTNQENILSEDQTNGETISGDQTNNIYKESSIVPEEDITQKAMGIGFEYYSGSKINDGFQVHMKFAWQKTGWEYGHDIGFMYLNIINEPYTGYLYSFCFPAYIKYNFSSEKVSPYIGGSVQLMAGTEKYNNNSEQVEFFLGPASEEYLGLSINRTYFIEAGIYELLLINSKILPDDFGFRLSCHFLFNK